MKAADHADEQVFTFVKTDRLGGISWGVKHNIGRKYR